METDNSECVTSSYNSEYINEYMCFREARQSAVMQPIQSPDLPSLIPKCKVHQTNLADARASALRMGWTIRTVPTVATRTSNSNEPRLGGNNTN